MDKPTSGSESFDAISLEIMWSRLIGIADDMWTTVYRTAVSTSIGASQDFGCEILDAQGRSVAHAQRSMPVFNFVMPVVTRAIIEQHPIETMVPGDVFITNDPWVCAGHLDDIAIVTPVFHGAQVVAFAATVAHTTSIGGTLTKRTVRDIYEEGLRIPILKFYDAGRLDETAWAFIEQNVRTPEMVLTDIQAQLTANDLAAKRIVAFLDEYRLPDLAAVAEAIHTRSEHAMSEAIHALPNGVYEHEVWTDGLDRPARLRVRITVHDDWMEVDYTGSDPQRLNGGLDCVLPYTKGHTVYPLKCLLSPEVPASEGIVRPFEITAPKGSILNCDVPASIGSRTRTGWHLHPLLFGALAPVLPDRVQAGNGLMHTIRAYGQNLDGTFFNTQLSVGGGRGASRGRDGIGRNCFPSSARNVPVEIMESRAPILVRERALRPDSAGAGEWRGAAGHRITFSILPSYPRPVSFFLNPDWLRFSPRGLAGGEPSPGTRLSINGHILSLEEVGAGQIVLETPDDRLEWHIPGGGGYGPSEQRVPAAVEADVQSGLVSLEGTPLAQPADD